MPLCIGRVPCLCENDKKKKMVRKFSSKYFPQEEKFGKNLILEKLGFIIFEPHKKKEIIPHDPGFHLSLMYLTHLGIVFHTEGSIYRKKVGPCFPYCIMTTSICFKKLSATP